MEFSLSWNCCFYPLTFSFLQKTKCLLMACLHLEHSVHFETYDSCQCKYLGCCYCSVTKSCLTLRPHRLQHSRLPCPSLSPGVCSNSCPLNWWCYLTISPSAAPFSFCLQSFPELVSQLLKRQNFISCLFIQKYENHHLPHYFFFFSSSCVIKYKTNQKENSNKFPMFSV